MKKLLILCTTLLFFVAKADEGMWMPQMIAALKFADMKKNGFKLTAEQIYSINKASMKDAVVIFGGGCTGEVISDKGLILTNHHCGFSSIAALSSVEKDYLKNGYWAMNAGEELQCKNLSVTFIKRIDDVTLKVIGDLKPGYTEVERDSAIHSKIVLLEKASKQSDNQTIFIRPFYYGNEYYMFTAEVFKDIRLVGAPPESIGKFGGETDNWVWPRHNADFSMFRIYAGKDNQPAEFSTDNVPYKPAYSFPISIKGVEKGDFTMVYGFPGRTQEYLTSYAVDFIMNVQDPLRVNLRGKRLEIIEATMKKNDTLRLMYTGGHARVANYHKKWNGEMQGLRRSNAVEKKQDFEKKLMDVLNADSKKKEQCAKLMNELKDSYLTYAPISVQYDYYAECLMGVDAFRMLSPLVGVFAELDKKKAGVEHKYEQIFKTAVPAVPFKNYDTQTDRKLCYAMLSVYQKEISSKQMPFLLDSLFKAFNQDVAKLTDYLYNNSVFVDNKKAAEAYANFESNADKYRGDIFYRLAIDINNYYAKQVIPALKHLDFKINDLQKEYMKLLMENVKDKKFYPDANSTMRITYGKVDDYFPRDGVKYLHYTTLDGLMDKNNTGHDDFYVPQRLKDLHKKKDYGVYADKSGNLRVAFIGSNHTTGGE
ncbi:MAG: S46 family peptidase [Sphingobacteriaceae bacterium]|nr:S46 family peptidase [Sphingobacteriaceae bacterium]